MCERERERERERECIPLNKSSWLAANRVDSDRGIEGKRGESGFGERGILKGHYFYRETLILNSR